MKLRRITSPIHSSGYHERGSFILKGQIRQPGQLLLFPLFPPCVLQTEHQTKSRTSAGSLPSNQFPRSEPFSTGATSRTSPKTHANAVSRNPSSTTSSRFNCTLGDSHLLAAAPAITLTRAGFTVASRSHWTCAPTHRHERLPGRRAHEPAHAHASQEA